LLIFEIDFTAILTEEVRDESGRTPCRARLMVTGRRLILRDDRSLAPHLPCPDRHRRLISRG
jgi:hypothetical protein